MVRREFARLMKRRDLRLLWHERAKKERQLAQDSQVSLAQTTRVTRQEFPANSREHAKLLLLEPGSLVLLVAVNRLRGMAPPRLRAAD